MPIPVSFSSSSLLEKNNLRRTMNYFDAAEKIHVGADASLINSSLLVVFRSTFDQGVCSRVHKFYGFVILG